MKNTSLPALLVAPGLLFASIFSINQPVQAATGKFAPAATVDAFFLTVGQTDPGATNLVCKKVKLVDQDTPVENLKVTIPGQENIPWVSLKDNTHTVCVDTSNPVPLNVLRLRVTDGEFVDLFETTVLVAAPANTAPEVNFADLTAALNEANGKKCQDLVVTDKEDASDKLQIALETKHEGLTLENGKVCVDTTKPLEQMPVTVAVTDTGDMQTKATAQVRVIAPPHISVEPIKEQVRPGEVCHPIKVTDLDSAEAQVQVTAGATLPSGVVLKARQLCVDVTKPVARTEVTLVATDEANLTGTTKVAVEVKEKPTTPEPEEKILPKHKPKPQPTPNPGKPNTDQPKAEKKPITPGNQADAAGKQLPKTGGQSGSSSAAALALLAAGGVCLALGRTYVRR